MDQPEALSPITALLPWQQPVWDELVLRQQRTGLPHALMFTGLSGLGKHRVTLKTAHWLLCTRREAQGLSEACGECHSCRLWEAGNHPDFIVCEPQDGSRQIRIDGIRKVNEFLNQTPQISPCQVVILHPAEVLNTNSANALLKTLEEPPGESFLLLESERPAAVLPTIRSRCQSVPLALPEQALSMDWLQQQGVPVEQAEEALRHNHFAPLAALEWHRQGGAEKYQQWLGNLCHWAEQKQRLDVTIKYWKDDDLAELLSWMATLLLDLTKARSGVPEALLRETRVTNRFACATLSLTKLLALHARATSVLGEIHSGASYHNRQLLLETLLIDWQSMLTSNGS